MPLILLGLMVIVGIVIYALVVYGSSVDDEDIRPAGEVFSDVFEKIRDRFLEKLRKSSTNVLNIKTYNLLKLCMRLQHNHR